jgi:ABC-2 type transport system permease protein
MNMPNQVKAALTISKYSLLATLRSPTSVVFSLLFPIIFIVVFGSMATDRAPDLKIAPAPDCDTANPIYKSLKDIPHLTLVHTLPPAEQKQGLQKGKVDALISIVFDTSKPVIPYPTYLVTIHYAGAGNAMVDLLRIEIEEIIRKTNEKLYPHDFTIATVKSVQAPGRNYEQIDFILPGQLGFSLLMAGVFGSSFLLFNLRQSLVLKRLRATPIRKRTIIAGEMLSRLFFHIIGFMIMVGLGYFAFNFTLVNGMATFAEMLVYSLFGLGIFMGIGFVISGVLQNESSISPVANTIVLPQILLCGLFFPIESYPHWLQGFCNLLPLTFFVDGLRKIAFEGAHIWEMPFQVIGLIAWTIVISAWSVKAFKWE